MNKKIIHTGLFLAGSLVSILPATAGTFAEITADGNISDWSSISPIATDANEAYTFDINQIYMANNATNLFILITYNNAVNPNSGSGLFLGFDNDSNLATGFDVYAAGIIGTEAAYQNDFPFEQATGVFNTGATSTDASIGISPYNTTTSFQEFSVSRSAIIDAANSQALFPNDSFNFIAYFNDTDSDVSAVANYTFAVPEPSQAALMLGLGTTLLALSRRKQLKA